MRRSEIVLVTLSLALAHGALFAAHLPLAQRDLSSYMEPGIYLAQTGRLAGPASQHLDLTSYGGYYFYPPGYFLLVAGWVKLFGHGPDALLAFTQVAHFGFALGLWALIRTRIAATVPATTLAVASVFASFNHGRPDVVALLFGTMAWLVSGNRAWRVVAAAFFLAAAILNSPAHGLGACGAVGGFELARGQFRRAAWLRLASLAAVAAGIAGVVVVSVLTWQTAWDLAVIQWSIHSRLRGDELKSWPSPWNAYMMVFCLIPLVVLTLPPLAWAVFRSGVAPTVRHTAIGYLLGAAVQIYLVPADFLTVRHLNNLGRPAFQAALTASSGWLCRAGNAGLIYYAALNTYYHKNQIWPVDNNRDFHLARVAALELPPDTWIATDSQLFPVLYRHDRTLSYEILRVMDRWETHRGFTPPALFESAVPPDRRLVPADPEAIVISAATVLDVGPPAGDRFVLLTPGNLPCRYRLFGRAVRLCDDPFAPVVYARRDRVAALVPRVIRAGLPVDPGLER